MKIEKIFKYLMLCFFWMIVVSGPLEISYSQENSVIDREAEDFDFANGLFYRGMYDMAAKEYQNFIKKYPESRFIETADYRTIECYFLDDKYEQALSNVDVFLQKEDISEEYKNRTELIRSRIYLSKGDYETSEKIIKELVSGDYLPDVTESAWYYYAAIYYARKQYDKTKDVLRDFLSKYDNGEYVVLGYLKLGDIFLEEGMYPDAAENYTEAVNRSSDTELSVEAAFRAAGAYYKAEDYESAVLYYEKAAEYGKESKISEKILLGLISALYKNGQYSDVINKTNEFSDRLQSKAIKAQILFLQGNSYFQEEQFSESEKIFFDIARKYPDTEFGKKAGLNECWALYESGNLEKCISRANDYMDAANGLSEEALYVKAKALIGMEKKQEALQIYNDLLTVGGNTLLIKDVLYDAGWLSLELGLKEEAVKYYQQFFERYPTDKRAPEVLLKLGQWMLSARNFGDSIKLYSEFISKFGKDPLMENALFQLGSAYFENGEYEKSIDEFEKFIIQFPDSKEVPAARYAIAMNYQKNNKWKESIAALEKLLNDPKGVYYEKSLESVAYCYFQQEDLKSAAETYDKLINEKSDYLLPEGVYIWLADYFFTQKEYKESIRILKTLLEKYPGSANEGETVYMLGKNYVAMEKWKAAIKYFDKAVSTEIGSPFRERSFLGLGKIYLRMGDFEKSLGYLNSALENYQENITGAQAKFEIGNVNFKMGKYEEAAKQYMMVAILYEDKVLCPDALFKAGTAFDKCGDSGGALEAFGELVKKYPDNQLSEKAGSEIRRIEVETR